MSRRLLAGVGVAAALLVAGALWLGGGGESNPSSGATADVDRKSVAVLPFTNTSGDADNASFTAGIHDDVLTQLAKVGDLKVISRTSVLEYEGTTKNMRQIGEELGVAVILEGGVQRVGDMIRMNVQLIDAATDEHLWAETYDRDLTVENLLAIQSDIAQRIAGELEATLTPAERERIEAPPTENIEAYAAYLRGQALIDRTGFQPRDHLAALAQFERAVELDPQFALAHASLGALSAIDYFIGFDTSPERLSVAREAIDLAQALAPDLPNGYFARGFLQVALGETDSAAVAAEAAEAGGLRERGLYLLMAIIEQRRGNWAASEAAAERSAELDPRDAGAIITLAENYWVRGRYDEAVALYDRALAREPDLAEAAAEKAWMALQMRGDPEPLRRFLVEMPMGAEFYGAAPMIRWMAEYYSRDFEAALAVVGPLERPFFQVGWWVFATGVMAGWTHAALGDPEAARAAYESARVALEGELRERPEHPGLHSALGYAYAGLGRTADAIREGRRAVELLPSSRDRYFGPHLLLSLAWIYVEVGEYDTAIDTFDEYLSAETADWSVEGLLLDPRMDRLRDQPGFERILAHRN